MKLKISREGIEIIFGGKYELLWGILCFIGIGVFVYFKFF